MCVTLIVRFCLLKFSKSRIRKSNAPIPLEKKNEENHTMKILVRNDRRAIKNLIVNSNDDRLKKNLRFLNMDGSVNQDTEKRREMNKMFLRCLVEVQQDYPSALIWLKRNIDSDICDTMLSDWKYTGDYF